MSRQITIFQAIRRARAQRRLGWALGIAVLVLLVVAGLKFAYYDASMHSYQSGPGGRLAQYLMSGIGWLYEKIPPVRWLWNVAPMLTLRADISNGLRSLLTFGNLWGLTLLGLGFVSAALRQAAGALQGRISEVFKEHEKEQWRDQLHGHRKPPHAPTSALMHVIVNVGSHERWWQRPVGMIAIGILVTVTGGLLVEWLK